MTHQHTYADLPSLAACHLSRPAPDLIDRIDYTFQEIIEQEAARPNNSISNFEAQLLAIRESLLSLIYSTTSSPTTRIQDHFTFLQAGGYKECYSLFEAPDYVIKFFAMTPFVQKEIDIVDLAKRCDTNYAFVPTYTHSLRGALLPPGLLWTENWFWNYSRGRHIYEDDLITENAAELNKIYKEIPLFDHFMIQPKVKVATEEIDNNPNCDWDYIEAYSTVFGTVECEKALEDSNGPRPVCPIQNFKHSLFPYLDPTSLINTKPSLLDEDDFSLPVVVDANTGEIVPLAMLHQLHINDYLWLSRFVKFYGMETLESLAAFVKSYQIVDLHAENLGYIKIERGAASHCDDECHCLYLPVILDWQCLKSLN